MQHGRSGERIAGGLTLITGIDGTRYAVRQQAITVIHDADECATKRWFSSTAGMACAPVWIVPCLQRDAPTRTSGSSIYPAVQNMLLAARALGLGATLTNLC